MAYRDDLETRRAHVGRLEEELLALEREEALVRSLPGEDVPVLSRLLGGPRELRREIVIEGPVGDLEARCNEVFGVDGQMSEEDGALVWRGEPEPRPRRVVVRAEGREDGSTRVLVRDRGNYRSYVLLVVFASVFWQASPGVLLVALLGALVLSAFMRKAVLETTRRRARQGVALEAALTKPVPVVRARVAPDEEDHEVHDEHADDLLAEASR